MSRLFRLLTFLIRALNYSNTNEAFRIPARLRQKIYDIKELRLFPQGLVQFI